MLVTQLAALIATAPLRTLDDLSRDVWKAHAGSLLTDIEAQELAESIHGRRRAQRERNAATPLGASTLAGASVAVGASVGTPDGTVEGTLPGTSGTAPGTPSGAPGASSTKTPRLWSYFPAKHPQRSPDATRSLERRRTLAASGPLPPALACKFTTGELAVLKLVSDEVRTKGTCVLSIPELAARAGVGATKARMALRIAASLGLVTIEERRVPYRPNLTNVVRIISREWLSWIAQRKPPRPKSAVDTARPGQGGGFTFEKATDSSSLRVRRGRHQPPSPTTKHASKGRTG
jgi:hypothetical protein